MGWIPLAMSAAGSLMQGQGQEDEAEANAKQLGFSAAQDDETAQQIQDQGYQTAKRIRDKGQQNVGTANADMAASGVDVSQGTAKDIREKVNQNAEQDALNTILSSDSKATNLRETAGYKRIAATDAVAGGKSSAMASLFKGAGSVASAWKTSSS